MGECSVTCGGGTRIDTRTKKSEAKYGGTCDPMGHERVVDCNTHICPRKSILSNMLMSHKKEYFFNMTPSY